MTGDELAETLLSETRHEIDRADGKANLLLAGAGLGISAMVGGLISGDLNPFVTDWPVQVTAGLAAILLTAGFVAMAMAVFPRLGSPEKGRARYFMDIALLKQTDEVRDALRQELNLVEDRNAQQLLVVSQIARRKYCSIRWGEILLALGLLSAAVAGTLNEITRCG